MLEESAMLNLSALDPLKTIVWCVFGYTQSLHNLYSTE